MESVSVLHLRTPYISSLKHGEHSSIELVRCRGGRGTRSFPPSPLPESLSFNSPSYLQSRYLRHAVGAAARSLSLEEGGGPFSLPPLTLSEDDKKDFFAACVPLKKERRKKKKKKLAD
ncbi:hypothetical protein CEXT_339381 [Caerostris extrusa]|uniref:Uncharacterized protein n=1 Tax=Caerostris extrusa TaxID=172846 RepID=A0AAV4TQP8_CAEEX|nr:hypothetical protein CEXT_339381 [Caerostris extrusa]